MNTTKMAFNSSIDSYIKIIHDRCEKIIPTKKKLLKTADEQLQINIKNYTDITTYNYTLNQLKKISKQYKLKISGNKNELIKRIYIYLYLSYHIIKIQKKFRINLQRKFNQYLGPAFKNRKLCNNYTDFITMEELNKIALYQFFSYEDKDGFIYGFDISSIYNLICKIDTHKKLEIKNPYNRNVIPVMVLNNLKKIIRISRALKINLNLEIDNKIDNFTNEKSVEMRALQIFQMIDSLGNYSSPNWFLSLSLHQLIKFIRELIDIWQYRAQLTIEIKKNICPPFGDPFRNINLSNINIRSNILIAKKIVLNIIEKFVNTGIDKDSKVLGAYYVLGALTLVNETAAASLPWLFQSVTYL
jgi:hypothetical protein